ncbi:CHAT domain-containing protein [Cryptosporangium aurantiacum]|uniref:CHAT domain-containing protein n=1 Tax=Cryptosporangium aurantiacum TaxID=134849 RepID=A0A1M7R1K9_9ACTN|nr:CHAT domain-containing protein [Cryptosporangium aurantiacum]SHN38547.1 CHAT domain-containing protein [Cryptosporangium aurantiacum]
MGAASGATGTTATGDDEAASIEALHESLRTGSPTALERAVTLSRRALDAVDAPDAREASGAHDVALVRANRQANLAAALGVRASRTGRVEDLTESVSLAQEAVLGVPDDDPDLGRYYSTLAASLAQLAELPLDADDRLELASAAIEAAREAVARTTDDDEWLPEYLSNLSAMLEMRHELVGDRSALDEAIDAGRRAVALARDRDLPGSAAYSLHLSTALLRRHAGTGDAADVDEAVEAAQAAANLIPVRHPDRPDHLIAVAIALATRAEQQQNSRDATEAVRLCRRAVRSRSAHPALGARRLANLAAALRIKYLLIGRRADITEAVEVAGSAVAATPPASTERGLFLAILGAALLLRFERGAGPDPKADLEAGTAAVTAALDRCGPGTPLRRRCLINLSDAARARFLLTGATDDLDAAVRYGREAVDEAAAPPQETAAAWTNLASALHARFQRLRMPADLDDAVHAAEQAAAALRPDDPLTAARLANVATVRQLRHAHTRARRDAHGGRDARDRTRRDARDPTRRDPAPDADRQVALRAAAAAVDALRPDAPESASVWSTFGNTLLGADDSDAAVGREVAGLRVDAHRHALALTARRHRSYRSRLADLAGALAARYHLTGDAADLREAIRVQRRAVAASTNGADPDPDHARMLSNLAVLLRARYERTRRPGGWREAADRWRAASAEVAAPVTVRVGAAYSAARLLADAGDLDAALTDYTAAIELLPRAGGQGVDRQAQEQQLALWSGLASDAAACAVACGRPERAVELLELGRSVVWAQILHRRDDFADLARIAPDVAAELAEVRDRLDHYEAESALVPLPAADRDEAVDRLIRDDRVRLAARWDELVARARTLPGFERFLAPASFSSRAVTAGGDTIVLVNVSALRSDALVVTAAGPAVVPLPGLTPAAVERAARHHLGMLDGLRRPDPDVRALDARLRDTLAWLWRTVAAPVAEALAWPERSADLPRVWWIPTGLLSLLPLHAAQRYLPEEYRDSGLPDRVVSSYASTLDALRRSRRPADAPPVSAVLVTLAGTPDRPELPYAAEETSVVAGHLGDRPRTELADAAATWAAVTDAVVRHSWLHFAGHAEQRLGAPGRGGLRLADRPLTVFQLAALRASGEFAFLSSCETALTGVELPDEAFSTAAGFQIAGYRQVVAALWPVPDDVGPRLAGSVYDALRALSEPSAREPAERVPAAVALHAAVRELRATGPLLSWAAYCHIGA